MRKRTEYEWDVESVDKRTGDVLDHNHTETCVEALQFIQDFPDDENERRELVLVRDVFDASDAVVDRTWAYVADGALPAYFADACGEDATQVPKRFHAELNAARLAMQTGATH